MNYTPVAAAQIIVTIVPIIGIIFGFLVIFFYLLWNHKQKMFLIQKDKMVHRPVNLTILSLFAGTILTGIGTALTLFFSIKDGLSYGLLGGIIPLTTGFSLIIFFIIRITLLKHEDKHTNN